MHADLAGSPAVIVLLNSFGKLTPFGDANRVRKWVERSLDQGVAHDQNCLTGNCLDATVVAASLSDY